MPLDGTNYYGSGGNERSEEERWNRICKRVNHTLDNFARYEKRLGRMTLSYDEKKIKEIIACMGFSVSESKILAEEGGSQYNGKIAKNFLEAVKMKDSIYSILVVYRDINNFEDLKNNPAAIKARKIYEAGIKQVNKILDGLEK